MLPPPPPLLHLLWSAPGRPAGGRYLRNYHRPREQTSFLDWMYRFGRCWPIVYQRDSSRVEAFQFTPVFLPLPRPRTGSGTAAVFVCGEGAQCS